MAHAVVRDESEPVATTEYRSTDTLNMVGRFVAVVAAAVPTIIGLIALAKFDWNGFGFDAPAVSVAGMAFRPWVAVATVVLYFSSYGVSALKPLPSASNRIISPSIWRLISSIRQVSWRCWRREAHREGGARSGRDQATRRTHPRQRAG